MVDTMKALLLLLSMLGWCCGLKPGMEYSYHYIGRVASGITDFRHQFSAAGIQSDVIVQVAEDYSAIVKFDNVEVGDFHGDFKCDMNLPLPIEYHRLEEGVELLEKPFKVTVNGSQVIEFLEVPLNEPAWFTNIRKAVVNIFRIRPFGIQHTPVNPNFDIREDTMIGYCNNWYNVIKLPQEDTLKEDYERDHIMQEDAERGGSIDETLWRVTRTVDFDNCDYLPTMKGHVNTHTEALFSRSSVGSYLIRGNANNMRIERALVEGSISLFTQDDHKEHFDTFTNQTLELKGVRSIQQKLTIDYEVHQFHSWHYEVEHNLVDQKVKGVQPSLEQILTGAELTEDVLTGVKEYVKFGIQNLSGRKPKVPSHNRPVVSELSHVIDAIHILHYQHLEQIYDQYVQEYKDAQSQSDEEVKELHEEKLYLLKEAMIASGTEPAITCILTKMGQEDFEYEDTETIYNLFYQVPMTIKSPSYITKLMDIVMEMTWDDKHKSDKSVALVTFSQLLNKMCFSSERRSTYWDTTCQQDHICPTDSIIDTFIPYLQRGLENEEIPIWYRLIYLQALTSLGSAHAINILEPYILGTAERHISFRKIAIWGLSKPSIHSTAINKVFEILMPVFENVAENHELRNIAFMSMATWEPSVSWWQSMAMATWHEPSNKVANFVSSTIQNTADMHGARKMSEAASRVKHLAKPAAPTSIIHSSDYYLLEYMSSHELDHRIVFAWLASSGADSLIPFHIYFRLKFATFLGFTHDFKMSLQHIGGDELLLNVLEFLYEGRTTKPGQDVIDVVMEMFNQLKTNVGFEPHTSTSEKRFFVQIESVFRFFVGFEGDDFKTFDYNDYNTFVGYFHRILNSPHYYRYVDAFVAIPTELGVPFIAKETAQYTWSNTLSQTVSQAMGKASIPITLDYSRIYSVETKTLIPWSKKFAIGTGTKDMFSILLPFNIEYQLDFKNYELQLTFKPLTNDKVNLIAADSMPYTIQYGQFPTVAHYMNIDFKPMRRFDDYPYTRKTQALPSVMGLWMESEWTGDIHFPINLGELLYKGEFCIFTPRIQRWDYHLLYDPEASSTKSLSTIFTYVSSDKTLGSQSPPIHIQDPTPTRERITKIQEEVVLPTGGIVRSISMDFHLQGPPTKKYDAILTWVSGIVSSKTSTKFQFSWIQDLPNEQHATCLNVQLQKPHILPLTSVEDVLKTNFHATLKADLHDGVNCEQPAVLNMEGKMDVSTKQVNIARKNLTEEHCGSESDFLPVDLITSPIYDHIQMKFHWTEEFPIQMKNFTYFAYDMIRGFVFPDIYYDYTATNQDHEVEFDATKCLETHRWNIHTTKPTQVSIIEDFEAPYMINVIASPAPALETVLYDFLNGRRHQACVIDQHKIRTSDGLEIPYQPDECWNVIAMDTTDKNYGSVEIRFHDGQWEARVLHPVQGLRLELTKTTLKVNGEDFTGHDDRFNVVYLEDGIILTLPFLTDNILKISDKVYYLEDQMFRSWVAGLCGNLDGEIPAEMMGPKGCIYTDPDLFVKSWTTPGEGCIGDTYQTKMTSVEAYQSSCPHHNYVPTGVTYPNMMNDCMEWEYQKRTEGIYKCKALIPTPKCKPGCVDDHVMEEIIKYDCEVTEQTGSHEAHECHLHEYKTIYPGHCRHQ